MKYLILLSIIILSSCSVLYRKDKCGNRPTLKPIHRTEINLGR